MVTVMWLRVCGPESPSIIWDRTAISSPGLFSTKSMELFTLEPKKTAGGLSLIVTTEITTSSESLNTPSDVVMRAVSEFDSGSDRIFTYCTDCKISDAKLELIGPTMVKI